MSFNIIDGIKNKVDDFVEGVGDTVNGVVETGKRVGGFIKEDFNDLCDSVGGAIDDALASPQEKAAKDAAEKKAAEEAAAAEEAKKAEEKAAAEAEAKRMEELQKSYILHTAALKCSQSSRFGFVVVPVSHGEFIQGIPQLNVGDSKPGTNIIDFGVCLSSSNPDVQKAAKEIIKKVDEEVEKTFSEKVMGLFCKKPDPDEDLKGGEDSLVSKCAAPCKPVILTEWIDGKEDVLIDGKAALLGKCKLMCKYDGEITLFTSGQQSE